MHFARMLRTTDPRVVALTVQLADSILYEFVILRRGIPMYSHYESCLESLRYPYQAGLTDRMVALGDICNDLKKNQRYPRTDGPKTPLKWRQLLSTIYLSSVYNITYDIAWKIMTKPELDTSMCIACALAGMYLTHDLRELLPDDLYVATVTEMYRTRHRITGYKGADDLLRNAVMRSALSA